MQQPARTRDERGQIVLLSLFFVVGLALAALSVANIGMMISERVRAQNAVDAAAYSAATVQARYMNLVSYVNRAMIANYNTIAFNMALRAASDSFDHGSAAAVGTMYTVATILGYYPPGVAAAGEVDKIGSGFDKFLHAPTHALSRYLKSFFTGNLKPNERLEAYNARILPMYHGVLYAAAQSLRHPVAYKAAKEIDPDLDLTTMLSMGAETGNAAELAYAVDIVVGDPKQAGKKNPLNKWFESIDEHDKGDADRPLYFGAAAEASFDRFAAGRTRSGNEDLMRNLNTGNLISGTALKIFIWLQKKPCEARQWFCKHTHLCKVHKCYGELALSIGSRQRWGYETSFSQDRVPIISRKRIREVNMFALALQARIEGIDFGRIFGGTDLGDDWRGWGYTSASPAYDIAHYENLLQYPDKASECWRWIIPPILLDSCKRMAFSDCSMNRINACMSELETGIYHHDLMLTTDPHWDGNFSEGSAIGVNYLPEHLAESIKAKIAYIKNVGWHSPRKVNQPVPAYEFANKLDVVPFSNYTYRRAGQPRAAGNSRKQGYLTGPSVGIVGVKRAEKIRGLRLGKLANRNAITVMARAQVYYQGSPYRQSETPSVFNPYWGVRLAPISGADSPIMLRKMLPYLGSGGIPIDPTH